MNAVGHQKPVELAREPDVMVGPLQVRPSVRQVGPEGGAETLEPRIMQVLVALARMRGQVVTREDLIQSCWDGRAVGDDAINRCISKVRKLGEAHDAFRLETIPRVGYRMTVADEAASGPASGVAGGHVEAPSLAVLPFANRSGLPEDDVFADGMVEDVIAVLSNGMSVRVLGSLVTAGLRRGALPDLAAIGRQLGVRYLLEGNVRRTSGDLRVTTQLLEAKTGAVLWAGNFDRPLAELAALQEELVVEVAARLDVQVHLIELQNALRKPDDLSAWAATQRAMAALRQTDTMSLMRAVTEAQSAVTIAPDYAQAHGLLAVTSAVLYFFTSPDDPVAVERIRGLADRALALGADDPFVLSNAAAALTTLGFPDAALHPLMRALRKAPGLGPVHYVLGWTYCALNRPDEALVHLAEAARLMPVAYMLVYIGEWRANALIRSGKWEEAEASLDEILALNPEYLTGRINKALIRLRAQEHEEARRLFAPLRDGPLTLEQVVTLFSRAFANSAAAADLLTGIRTLWGQVA